MPTKGQFTTADIDQPQGGGKFSASDIDTPPEQSDSNTFLGGARNVLSRIGSNFKGMAQPFMQAPSKTLEGIAANQGAQMRGEKPPDVASDFSKTYSTDKPKAFENLAGDAATVGLLHGVTKIPAAIRNFPTSARAGAMLNEVGQKVGNAPIPLTRTMPALEEAQRLSEYGHGTITPLDKLYQRTQQINPIEYPEARGRYSPLTRLTANDRMNATPQLKAASGGVAKAMRADIGDVAEQHGAGEPYEKGMRMYGQAQTLKSVGKNLGKAAIGAGAGAAIGYPLYNRFRSLIP